MAIDFHLDLGTPLVATQVAGEIQGIAQTLSDEPVTADLLLGEGMATRLRMWIRMGDEIPRPYNPVTEDLGFTPTVWMAFRQYKFTDMCAQDDEMIRLVSGLLDRVSGDAVLHFQGEQIWLLRREGELSLSEDDDIWPPQRLALVTQPYRRATYAFD